jgi:hypothetical protein
MKTELPRWVHPDLLYHMANPKTERRLSLPAKVAIRYHGIGNGGCYTDRSAGAFLWNDSSNGTTEPMPRAGNRSLPNP